MPKSAAEVQALMAADPPRPQSEVLAAMAKNPPPPREVVLARMVESLRNIVGSLRDENQKLKAQLAAMKRV